MENFSASFEQSWSEQDDSMLSSPFGLLDLPSEVLVLILRYLPLSDLANARLVSSRLQQLVDAKSSKSLWALAPLLGDCQWLSADNKRIIERAADCGNVEALIKLAVAYLYDEGVPACDGKGSYDSYNGIKATEYLIQAEALSSKVSLFSWVLFRPPWSSEVISSKMCVLHHMRLACHNAEANQQPLPGVHYSIGKALSFYSPPDDEDSQPKAVQGARDPLDWFQRGAALNCPFSALEMWREKCKPKLRENELESMRQLRGILSVGGRGLFEAELELCKAYARGYYGGVGELQALSFIRQTMEQAKPFLSERIFTLQDLNPDSRYILIDWLFEVACLKDYSPQVAHLIVNIVDSYLLQRHICKAKLQLLAISAALLVSRWCVKESLTIREASWLTDRTYEYDDVVRMVGELVAVHRGNVKKPTIVDYLDILLSLIKADSVTRHMAYYLSESVLLYPKFGRFTASFLAAACLLEARVLLGHEYPWSSDLVQATGLAVGDLKACCLTIYQLCLTDNHRITDSREVQLKAVVTRYSSESFSGVSQISLMSYKELKEQLGWDQDVSCALFTPPVSAKRNNSAPKHKKRLSFLSDSQYLTSPSSDSSSDGELDDSHSYSSPRLYDSDSHSNCFSTSLLDAQIDENQDVGFLLSPPGCGIPSLSPGALSRCSSQSLTVNPNGSGFPQPVFALATNNDDEDSEEEGEVCLATCQASSRLPSSNGTSSLYASTDVRDSLHPMMKDDDGQNIVSCSTSASSLASGASCTALPTLLDDEDSRSMMDTLPPCSSNSQTDELELASFVSRLQLPTPSFGGALERDAENTPFEFDLAANHTMAAAVKQNLHLGSCDPKHPSQSPRAPLQSLENFVGGPYANLKPVRPVARGTSRARSFIVKDNGDRRAAFEKRTEERWNTGCD